MNIKLFTQIVRAYLLVQAAALLLLSCPSGGGTENDNIDSPSPTPITESGFVVFDNSGGLCTVRVYTSSGRDEGSFAAEVAQGARSEQKTYQANSSGFTFYFSYITVIDDVPLPYIPSLPAGVQTIRIDRDSVTTAVIPAINTTVPSQTTLLTTNSYIVIKNESVFSLSLVKGITVIKPENYETAQNGASYIVNGGEKAVYKLNLNYSDAEDARIYKIHTTNGSELDLHNIVPQLQAGHIYVIRLSGQNLAALAPVLDSEKPITLSEIATEHEISTAQRQNGDFSFTKWRDVKLDETAGGLVSGDNTIEFYANSARLNGNYWRHPNGSYNYSGQILESEYRTSLQAMVIWVNKPGNTGFLLEKQPDGALQLRTATVRHPFYKQ
jgi:hypothetical protein